MSNNNLINTINYLNSSNNNDESSFFMDYSLFGPCTSISKRTTTAGDRDRDKINKNMGGMNKYYFDNNNLNNNEQNNNFEDKLLFTYYIFQKLNCDFYYEKDIKNYFLDFSMFKEVESKNNELLS